MKEINEKLDNLRIGSNAESIKQDLSRGWKSHVQCGPRRIISEMGNVELSEGGKTKPTVQCQVCYKHVWEGIIFCQCRNCVRPDEDIRHKVKERFGMLIAPYYVLHMRNALGKKHGEQPWQVHPWKEKDAYKGVKEKGYITQMLDPCCNDGVCKNSQPAVGWCETFCKFVDYLDKVDISCNAPMHGRTRYLNQFFFVSGDPDLQVGPVEKREDCKKSLQALFCVRKEQGRGKTFTPKERNWKRSFFLKNHQILHRHGHTIGGTVTNGKKVAGESTNGGKAGEPWSYSNWQKVASLQKFCNASTVRHEPS